MHRGCLFSVFAAVGLAQLPPQQEDPVQAAISAYRTAREQGRFEEAAAQRNSARNLLAQIPRDSPQLGVYAQNVAWLYQSGGWMQQAIAVAEQALARAAGSEDRILLLLTVADLYQQEQNLLQAVVYLERVVAALEEQAAKPAPPNKNQGRVRFYSSLGGFRSGMFYDDSNRGYQQLAGLYQQLGRPEAVAAITKKTFLLAKDPNLLAALYREHGQPEEAATIYKGLATQSEPAVRVAALQSLANLYEQQQRYADAADAYRQAIATQNAIGKPEQATWLYFGLAAVLNRGGQTKAADQVYEKLLAETGGAADSLYPQVISNFANYLGETKRNSEGLALLSNYLTSHPNLSPQDQGNLLSHLSNAAARAGDSKLTEQYRQAAAEKFQSSQPPAQRQILIAPILQAAQSAAQAGKLDDAFELCTEAMESFQAVDRDQIVWQIPTIAYSFANKQPERQEQLYRKLLATVESWSAENARPLLSAVERYSQHLLSSPARWNDIPALINRYRDLVVASHGETSGTLHDVYRLKIQYEQSIGDRQAAVATAQEQVALTESLSGNTSVFYIQSAEQLGRACQAAGDLARASAIFTKNVAISDLAYPAGDLQRAYVRLTAATVLAEYKQYDEAERLAKEAVAIGDAMKPPQGGQFTAQIEQIRKMRPPAPLVVHRQ